LVVVEGRDDQALVAALVEHLGLEEFQVHSVAGKTGWIGKIKAIANDDSFNDNVERVGFMRDADADGRASWQSCVAAIVATGLTPPISAGILGGSSPGSDIRAAVHIVPSVTDNGAIEDLLLPTLDPARVACIDSYLACLEARQIPCSSSGKTRFKVYLAALPVNIRDISVALAKGYINLAHPNLESMRLFLQALAQLTP
jgi:hypothetical protein